LEQNLPYFEPPSRPIPSKPVPPVQKLPTKPKVKELPSIKIQQTPQPVPQPASPRKKPPKDPRLSTLTEGQIMEKLSIFKLTQGLLYPKAIPPVYIQKSKR
jgi:hypothetical protein